MGGRGHIAYSRKQSKIQDSCVNTSNHICCFLTRPDFPVFHVSSKAVLIVKEGGLRNADVTTTLSKYDGKNWGKMCRQRFPISCLVGLACHTNYSGRKCFFWFSKQKRFSLVLLLPMCYTLSLVPNFFVRGIAKMV